MAEAITKLKPPVWSAPTCRRFYPDRRATTNQSGCPVTAVRI